MGIQINGNTDTISAIDGSLTVSGAELTGTNNINVSGILTATGGLRGSTVITSSVEPTPASGTNISGSQLSIRGGTSTGSAAGGSVSIVPSTGSGASGSGANFYGQKGLFVSHLATSWGNNPALYMLQSLFGLNTDQVNRSNLSNDGTVVTIDGANNGSQSALEIVGSSNSTSAKQGFIRFFGSSSKNPYATISAQTPGIGYTSGNLVVSTYNTGVENDVATFTSTGSLLIGTGTVTANGGVLQVSNGITFPGTQSACSNPNTLDDYEEGTFTPAIIGTTVAGTGTYTAQVGRYTKIGNRVHFQLYVISTAHTGSGNMRIAGLPFTSNSTSNNYCVLSTFYVNVTLSANNVIIAYVSPGTTEVVIAQTPAGGGGGTAVSLDATSELMFAGSYEV